MLRRYTDLPALIYALNNKCITLLDPATWDDVNDRRFLTVYGKARGADTVLALCFSRTTETYHHWRVFTQGSSGVCIEFYKDQLLEQLKMQEGIRSRDVIYTTTKKLKSAPPPLRRLPFLKRAPYSPEKEFRIIYEGRQSGPSLDITIDLKCIKQITLSPWLPKNLLGSVAKAIRGIDGCHKMRIFRTLLINNDDWQSSIESLGVSENKPAAKSAKSKKRQSGMSEL